MAYNSTCGLYTSATRGSLYSHPTLAYLVTRFGYNSFVRSLPNILIGRCWCHVAKVAVAVGAVVVVIDAADVGAVVVGAVDTVVDAVDTVVDAADVRDEVSCS